MGSTFTQSRTIVEELARERARTLPSKAYSSHEYIDRSLTILGRTTQAQSQRIDREFLAQRGFITD